MFYTERLDDRITVHYQWITQCMDPSSCDSLPSVLRSLSSTRPKTLWICYEPCIEVYRTFNDLFKSLLDLSDRSVESITSCTQRYATRGRLIALHQVLPKADELKKLKASSNSKNYIKMIAKETRCSYDEILQRPFTTYRSNFERFWNDLFQLVPPSDKDRRQRIEIARSEFILPRVSPADEFRNELERVHREAGPKWDEELSEMQLKGGYQGSLGQGAFDTMQWIEARLFLFSGAFVVLVLKPPQLIITSCAESVLVEASAWFGPARPIVEVLGVQQSFVFKLETEELREQLVQDWRSMARDKIQDMGRLQPIALGLNPEKFQWQENTENW